MKVRSEGGDVDKLLLNFKLKNYEVPGVLNEDVRNFPSLNLFSLTTAINKCKND
jgi:hypothetical protein